MAQQPEKTTEAVPDKVPRKSLGTTGETVPILLLGCAQRFDPVYDRILHRAFKEGVDYLDTALRYAEGQSHLTIAPFIKQVGRKNLCILSKGPSSRATAASFTRDLDTCLKQLETDYLDLYQIHRPAMETPQDETLRALDDLVHQGKVRYIGCTTYPTWMVMEALALSEKHNLARFITLQPPYNFLDGGRSKKNTLDLRDIISPPDYSSFNSLK